MLVLTRPSQFALSTKKTRPERAPASPPPQDLREGLQTVAIGLGTVQLLLDVGETDTARTTLLTIRDELQVLRRSLPA